MESLKYAAIFVLLVFFIGMFINRDKFTFKGNMVFSFVYCFFMLVLSIPAFIYYCFDYKFEFIEFFLIIIFLILLFCITKVFNYIDKLFKKYGYYKKK